MVVETHPVHHGQSYPLLWGDFRWPCVQSVFDRPHRLSVGALYQRQFKAVLTTQ